MVEEGGRCQGISLAPYLFLAISDAIVEAFSTPLQWPSLLLLTLAQEWWWLLVLICGLSPYQLSSISAMPSLNRASVLNTQVISLRRAWLIQHLTQSLSTELQKDGSKIYCHIALLYLKVFNVTFNHIIFPLHYQHFFYLWFKVICELINGPLVF